MKNLATLKYLLLLFSISTISFSAFGQTYPQIWYDVLPEQEVYFREKPDRNSPVTDTVRSGAFNRFDVIDDSDPQWLKVELSKSVPIETKGRLQEFETVYSVRYAERKPTELSAASEYIIKQEAKIPVRDAPNGQVMDTLNHHDSFRAIGSRSANWVKIGFNEWKETYNRKGKINGTKQVRHIYYMAQKDFSANTYPYEVDLSNYEPDLEDRLEQAQEKFSRAINNVVDARAWFPWMVLAGILLYFIFSRLLSRKPKWRIAVKFILLASIFVVEIIYIAIMGYGFWFCEPDQVGWLKAILFTIVSLGVVVMEFNMFFGLLDDIKTESRYFNTSVGIIIFTLITLVMFVYAIFSGGLSDTENQWLIYSLLGTQVLQIIVSAVQLRRYPLYALMAIILIPLGTFAILLTALSVFKFLVFFAIIGLALAGVANGKSVSKLGKDNSGSPGSARNCPHFDSDQLCNFYGTSGSRSACGMWNDGKCQHGFWKKL